MAKMAKTISGVKFSESITSKDPSTSVRLMSQFNNSDRERFSRADEVWQKVSAILDNGVLATVEKKQIEAREFLVHVETRLNEIIEKFNSEVAQEPVPLPESASWLHDGNINVEIQKAVAAINALTDKQLKFRLTVFIDDYRRILHQNREEEKQQVLAELEEYFKIGNNPVEEQEDETAEMVESLNAVSQEEKKLTRLLEDAFYYLRQMRKPTKESKSGESVKEARKTITKETPLLVMRDILNKPQNVSAMDPTDHALLMTNLEAARVELSNAVSGRAILRSGSSSMSRVKTQKSITKF